jgi:integrase
VSKFGADKLMSLLSGPTSPAFPKISVANAVTIYLDALARNGVSIRHVRSTRSHLRQFSATFTGHLTDINALELDSYLRGTSYSMKTRQNHRITLVTLFNFAKRKCWLSSATPHAAEMTENPKVPTSDPQVFTPEEMLKLLRAAHSEPMCSYLVIAGFAGVRRAEIERMHWSDWNREHNSLVLPTAITKTSRRRICNLEPNVAAWLTKLSERWKPEDRICPISVGNQIGLTAKAAGVRWQTNALRHSYVSYHLELHKNAGSTAKNAGHNVHVLEQNYLQLVPFSAAQAWFNLSPSDL